MQIDYLIQRNIMSYTIFNYHQFYTIYFAWQNLKYIQISRIKKLRLVMEKKIHSNCQGSTQLRAGIKSEARHKIDKM